MSEKKATVQEELSRWRRHLHRYPELSFKEFETTKFIIEELKQMPGVKVEFGREKIGLSTGVIATVGEGDGPVIGLRADIDALPIKETTNVSYQSCHEGVMHACGHDGHTAMLLGAVQVLATINQQTPLSGKVKCIFQPAEETEDDHGKSGAQYMIEAGVLSDVEAVVALHLDPELSVGKVKLCEGLAMANVDTFTAIIRGTGGHGAYPDQTADPIWLTSILLPTLYSLCNRRLSPLEPSVLSIGMIKGGAQTNVIPDSVKLKGTMRTYSEEARQQLEKELRTAIATVDSLGGTTELHVHKGEPALYNNPAVTSILREAIKHRYPTTKCLNKPYGMGGEDFSHMTKQIPGAMLFLGAKKVDKICHLHQPTFDIDERALEIGTQILVHTVLTSFAKGGLSYGT